MNTTTGPIAVTLRLIFLCNVQGSCMLSPQFFVTTRIIPIEIEEAHVGVNKWRPNGSKVDGQFCARRVLVKHQVKTKRWGSSPKQLKWSLNNNSNWTWLLRSREVELNEVSLISWEGAISIYWDPASFTTSSALNSSLLVTDLIIELDLDRLYMVTCSKDINTRRHSLCWTGCWI